MINDSRRGALVRGDDEVRISSVQAYRGVGSDDRTSDDVDDDVEEPADERGISGGGANLGDQTPRGPPLDPDPVRGEPDPRPACSTLGTRASGRMVVSGAPARVRITEARVGGDLHALPDRQSSVDIADRGERRTWRPNQSGSGALCVIRGSGREQNSLADSLN